MTARLQQPGASSPPDTVPDPAKPQDARSANRALATSAAVMASGTLVSRVLGLLRNALLVAVVGATLGMADAWSVANKLPNIISMLLAGGILNAVLVPQVVRAMKRRDGGQEYVNRLLTVAIAILLGITVVLTAAATLLITIYAANFPPEWKAVAVALAYWCIPQLFFYGLYTLLGQVLNARSIFGPYMWAPALNNVIAIAGLVAFLVVFGALPDGGLPASVWTGARITLLAGTATAGVVAQALVLIVPLYRSGFRFRPKWGLRGHGLGRASTVASWAFAALAVGQVGYLAVSNIAAAAGAAGQSAGERFAGNFAYDNAFLVFMLPQSLVTVSLVTALFTRVAHNAAVRDGVKVRDDLSLGLRTLAIFTMFATAAFTVLAVPLVQVVTLDRAGGGFADYRAIGAVLVAMAFGLTSIAIWTMVQRVFYAYEDTKTLFRIQVPMAGILIVGCVLSWWLLEPQWWVVGAGAATTLSNTVGAGVGFLATRKYLPNLDGARVLRTHLRVLMAAIPAALVGWGLLHLWGVQTGFWGALLRVAVIGLLMLAIYLVLVRLLRVSELDGLEARVRGPVMRIMRRVRGGGGDAPRSMSGSGERTGRGDQDVSAGTTVPLRAGDALADRFRLDREAHQTPACATWVGTDLAQEQPIQILLIDGPQREHVVDAARRAALIDDPHLPRVLRAGIEAGTGFVVTENVDGVTLADLLHAGPLPASQARAIVGEAATALESARRRGVHHLALGPATVRVTEAGDVQLTGLGTDAALRGTEIRDSREAGRSDAVGLVRLLYAALTATWPGDPQLAAGLPAAPTYDDVPLPAGDAVESVPNDLDTLCAVTFGKHDDGPFTPGELVADLAPWDDIELDPGRELPPVVRPAEPVTGGPGAGQVGGAVSATAAGSAAVSAAAAGAAAAGVATGAAAGQLDTSRWAPHPLPAAAEPTPFADLLSDTGTIRAVGPPHHVHAAGSARSAETHVSLPAVQGAGDAEPDQTASGQDAQPDAEITAVRAPVGEMSVATLIADEELPELGPDQQSEQSEQRSEAPEAEGTLVRPADGSAENTAAEGEGAGETRAVAVEPSAPLPLLSREPRGWDVPGGPAPESLPVPEPEPEPLSPAMRTGSAASPAGEEKADSPRASTAAAISGVTGAVGGGARRLLDGAGERLGTVTSRAGAFVEDVRDEFRPVDDGDDKESGPRFNPAPIALCVMVALVIFGLVLAIITLKDASTAFTPGPNPGDVQPTSAEASPTQEPTTAEPEPTEEPEAEGPPAASRVSIADAVTFDPTVSGGENQGDAYLAYDGNPDTTWNSLRYNSPTYGMKDGLGFTVELAQTALVSSVTLDVQGEGGLVEIRIGNASSPQTGTVLASGAMGSDVTYTFEEPVEADSISLWFPELPVADSDGRNRIELAEISLG